MASAAAGKIPKQDFSVRDEDTLAKDQALDAWRCMARNCSAGCVPPNESRCGSCGTTHKLAPEARVAVEARYQGEGTFFRARVESVLARSSTPDSRRSRRLTCTTC